MATFHYQPYSHVRLVVSLPTLNKMYRELCIPRISKFGIDMKQIDKLHGFYPKDVHNNKNNKDRVNHGLIDNSLLLSSSSSEQRQQQEDDESTTTSTTTTVENVLCIRANQGYFITSISSHKLLTSTRPDQLKDRTIIHGTYRQACTNHTRKRNQSYTLCIRTTDRYG